MYSISVIQKIWDFKIYNVLLKYIVILYMSKINKNFYLLIYQFEWVKITIFNKPTSQLLLLINIINYK